MHIIVALLKLQDYEPVKYFWERTELKPPAPDLKQDIFTIFSL